MAEKRPGTVVYWHDLSRVLAIFRLMPQGEKTFPDYKAGQYIALRREDCKLTKKIAVVHGHPVYGPDLDENGNQKIGPVTHSYSISSAPFETKQKGYLEFYVILERDDEGHPGRLTESIFRIKPQIDDKVTYFDRITGDFTLDKRAADANNIVLIGTGTGLAPFISMIKQLDYDGQNGKSDGRRYTLFHTNRIYEELGYHEELIAIQARQSFDFLYVPSVSRPGERDKADPTLGKGRATNLLRLIFGMPTKEEEALQQAIPGGENEADARAAFERTVLPVLPRHLPISEVQKRLQPVDQTVILTCGNPYSMEDVKYVADRNGIRFEKEDW